MATPSPSLPFSLPVSPLSPPSPCRSASLTRGCRRSRCGRTGWRRPFLPLSLSLSLSLALSLALSLSLSLSLYLSKSLALSPSVTVSLSPSFLPYMHAQSRTHFADHLSLRTTESSESHRRTRAQVQPRRRGPRLRARGGRLRAPVRPRRPRRRRRPPPPDAQPPPRAHAGRLVPAGRRRRRRQQQQQQQQQR